MPPMEGKKEDHDSSEMQYFMNMDMQTYFKKWREWPQKVILTPYTSGVNILKSNKSWIRILILLDQHQILMKLANKEYGVVTRIYISLMHK